MIALRVVREPSSMGATIGALYLNDQFICWTLEDAIREPVVGPVNANLAAWVKTWKVAGATAIPQGRYEVEMEWSPKFNRILPELRNVPGFSEIKFHAGNKKEDTEGCILVGTDRSSNEVRRSVSALGTLLDRLRSLGANERMFVDVENPPGRHFSAPLPSFLNGVTRA